jgi:hypothetical protein
MTSTTYWQVMVIPGWDVALHLALWLPSLRHASSVAVGQRFLSRPDVALAETESRATLG